MASRLSDAEEQLAQKLARYENICEEHSVELRKSPREDVSKAYEELKQQSGYVGQPWEPTQADTREAYIAHLEELCAVPPQSVKE